MRKYLYLFIALAITAPVLGQKSFNRNTVYAELFGNAITLLSLNYERQLVDKPGFGYRIGLGYYEGTYKWSLTLPAGINYLVTLSKNRSFIDIGAGATLSTA